MLKQIFFLNDDSKILSALQNGDEEALAELYRQNRRSITSFILRNQGNKDDAEDVLQEALVVLWEKIRSRSFEYQAKLSTFIYATAKNIWFRRLARQRREFSYSDKTFEITASDTDPLEEMEKSEQLLVIQKAMESIGFPCRDLLLLYYWEELTMEEIARKLGFANADTVKSKKYQCKKFLERLIKKMLGEK